MGYAHGGMILSPGFAQCDTEPFSDLSPAHITEVFHDNPNTKTHGAVCAPTYF